jgi:transposase-like protein
MRTLEQSLAQRAQILLLLDEGVASMAICEQVQIITSTVFKWHKRYVETASTV